MHEDINIVNTEQKLLFDIRKLLIEQNKLLKEIKNVTVKPIEAVKEVEGENIPKVKIDGSNCTLCGGDHKNIGVRLSCAKKNKNKEG